MKRSYFVIILVASIIILAGCNRNGNDDNLEWSEANASDLFGVHYIEDDVSQSLYEAHLELFLEAVQLLPSSPPVAGVTHFESSRVDGGNFILDKTVPITESTKLNEIISSNVNTFVDEFTEVSTKSQIFIRPQINVYSEHILGIVMNIIGLNDFNGLINTLQITYFDMWNNEQIFGEDFFGDNVDYRAIFAELANGFVLTGSEPFVFNDENILLYIPNANFYGAETNFGFTSFAMPMIYFNDIWQSPAETRSPRVALTFDDGPHYRYTTMLLDILAEHDALATFFPLGANIANNADIIRRMHNEGHSIGNHSFSHRSFTNLTADQIRNEINQANDAIYAITGQRPTLLRPPYGNFESRERTTINIVQEMGMSIALWSVDTRDWEFRDAIIIRDNILRLAQDGSVILLHDIREPTIRGVAMAMEALAARGFRFVTFEELYRPSEINIEPGSVNRGVYWDISRRDRGIFD